MKLFYVMSVLCLIFVATKAKEISEEDKETMKVLFSSCKEEQHATDADIDNMLNNKHPETTTGKCMAHCVMKQFTVIREKVPKSGLYEICVDCLVNLSKMKTSDEAKIKKLTDVANACKEISDPDACEFTAKLLKCLEAEAINHGLDPDSM